MKTIKLDVEREWRVIATSLEANGKDDERGGNLDVLGGSEVTWQADSSPGWIESFEVSFRDSANTTGKVWPFVEVEPSGKILTVKRGQSETLTTAGGMQIVKYDVRVKVRPQQGNPNPPNPAPLDPMIVIRPRQRSRVVAGLPWAIAGAVVGALIAWRLLSRVPM